MTATNAKEPSVPATDDAKRAAAQKPQAEEGQDAAAAVTGEDDEFEDFPVDDWPDEATEAAAGHNGTTKHLWEESWDDDDTSDDFSTQLKEELQKVEASKRR